jgi:UDPglucose 6-dehydrogenase
MNKKSIACIGQGFVGGSLTTVLSERNVDVYTYDKRREKTAAGGIIGSRTNVADLVTYCETVKGFTGIYFVCLPTPMNEDGSADLSIVEDVLGELASAFGDRIAVVKSTVPPGSVERWNEKFKNTGLKVVHNPEFLTEKNALNDFRNQNRIILGGPRPWINDVKQLFQSVFPDVPIIKTSSSNSEMIKYVTNCFLAMKLSFANEIYQLCEALDKTGLNVDYDRIIECAILDPRLGTSHWKVPSFETGKDGKPLKGWGLSCFNKDINALICKEKELGVKPTMTEATKNKNLEVRPERDWEELVGRAVSKKNSD